MWGKEEWEGETPKLLTLASTSKGVSKCEGKSDTSSDSGSKDTRISVSHFDSESFLLGPEEKETEKV